jgi:hypothetical protein
MPIEARWRVRWNHERQDATVLWRVVGERRPAHRQQNRYPRRDRSMHFQLQLRRRCALAASAAMAGFISQKRRMVTLTRIVADHASPGHFRFESKRRSALMFCPGKIPVDRDETVIGKDDDNYV